MRNILRWIVALPLAAISAFVIHMTLGFTFSIAHGFDQVSQFWLSSDMADMPISGTYIMIVTRVVTVSAFIAIAAWAVPKHHFIVGLLLSSIVGILTVALFIFTFYQSVDAGLQFGISEWYRGLLEIFSILLGCVIGSGVSKSIASSNEAALEDTKA